MNSTHHELSFELLHVGWHSNLQIFQILLMSGNTLSWGALTQQLARYTQSQAEPAARLLFFHPNS